MLLYAFAKGTDAVIASSNDCRSTAAISPIVFGGGTEVTS